MWPFDVQNCSVQLASWAHSEWEMTFDKKSMVRMESYNPNWEWKLVSAGINFRKEKFKYKQTETSSSISVNFVIERHAGGMHSIYICPMLVLMILTLSTLWLDPRSSERLIIASVSLLCHLLSMENLHWNLPFNGSETPIILFFYEYSFIIATFSLISTVMLREIHQLKVAPPKVIAYATSTVLRSKFGQILLLSILDPEASAILDNDEDDNVNLVDSSSGNQIWAHFTILLGWIFYFASLFTYLTMLIVFIPKMTY